MTLCRYCRTIEFSALPKPPDLNTLDRFFDDRELIASFLEEEDTDIPRSIEPGLPWQDSLETLAESAALDCPLCTMIQSAAKDLDDQRQAARNKSLYYQTFGADHDFDMSGKRLYLTQRFGGGHGLAVFILIRDSVELLLRNVVFAAEEGSPLAEKISLRPFCEDSGSSGALRAVSSWLKNCQDSHEKCCNDQTTLPSRVLAVGCTGDSSIRLIEPDKGTVGKYASLSHCWGSAQMLTTTHDSHYAHMSSISITELPKTFRDAVMVSRYLDIPYLWIDSLCIIQDDKKDWERESSQMMNVYSNAYVVIAANHASDSAGGCFHIRPSRAGAKLRLPGIGLVHAQLGTNSDGLLSYYADFSEEPLTKRAWALQERLLAARTIHYNSRQMYFECRHGIVGEDGCKTDTPYCDLSPVMNLTCSAREAHQAWSSIVQNYSNRNLTKPGDKFPAFSGIASLLGGLFKDDYVAGLWSSNMVQGLAWQGLWRPKPQPINDYIGPSWSWASVQGIAMLDTEPNWRSIAIVEDWNIELVNPDDHYGQVKFGSVRVRGPVAQLTQSTIPLSDSDERRKRAGLMPPPRFCTKYSGKGDELRLTLDNRDPSAPNQWQDMDIKVLLLGGVGGGSPVSQCEAAGEEAESKKDDSNEEPEVRCGFGLVLTSMNVNGAIYMKRVGWTSLDRNEVKSLRETKEDWDTINIV